MNRFETLLAPPSLSPKELRIHNRMHPELPREAAGRIPDELVKVSTRLHDELTTLRFPRHPADSGTPDEYHAVNRELTGSVAEPIEWKFFADEFRAFVRDAPRRDQVLDSIVNFPDPWRLQAWAAQALRIARNAETTDSKNAASAWRSAVRLYTAFFARSKVEDSHTYRLQTDPRAQESCQTAWDAFMTGEVAALGERAADYGKAHRCDAFAAAMDALAVPEVSAIDAEAVAKARAAAESAFVAGIRSAPTLKVALDMFRASPRGDERERALLAAMTTETRKFAHGSGDVKTIEACAVALKLVKKVGGRPVVATTTTSGALARSAREEFHEAVAEFSRVTVNDNAAPRVKKSALRLLRLLPPDREAGTHPDGTPITVARVIDRLVQEERAVELQKLFEDLDAAQPGSERLEKALNKLIKYAADHPELADIPGAAEALATALTVSFARSAERYIDNPRRNSRCLTAMCAVVGHLPSADPLRLFGETATPKGHFDRVRGVAAWKLSQEAPVGSDDERAGVEMLIELLKQGVDFETGSGKLAELAANGFLAIAQQNATSSGGNTETVRAIGEYFASTGTFPRTGAGRGQSSKPIGQAENTGCLGWLWALLVTLGMLIILPLVLIPLSKWAWPAVFGRSPARAAGAAIALIVVAVIVRKAKKTHG